MNLIIYNFLIFIKIYYYIIFYKKFYSFFKFDIINNIIKNKLIDINKIL